MSFLTPCKGRARFPGPPRCLPERHWRHRHWRLQLTLGGSASQREGCRWGPVVPPRGALSPGPGLAASQSRLSEELSATGANFRVVTLQFEEVRSGHLSCRAARRPVTSAASRSRRPGARGAPGTAAARPPEPCLRSPTPSRPEPRPPPLLPQGSWLGRTIWDMS